MDYQLGSFLQRFDELQRKCPGPIVDSVSFGTKGAPHLVVGLIIHGSEVGSLPKSIEFMEKLSKENQNIPYSISFFLGNRKAALLGVRYVETDLNRMFHDNAPTSLETNRANELKELLATADLFIDIHQAYRPSPYPFYTFSQHSPSDLWARTLESAPVWVTREADAPFDPGLLCADEWVRHRGIPAVTLELGYYGFSAQADDATKKVLSKSLDSWQLLANGYTTLEDLANHSPPLKLLWPNGNLFFESPFDKLKDGFNNFDLVQKGEILGNRENGGPIVAPHAAYILFPQYPKRDSNGQAVGHYSKEIIKFLVEK